MSWGRGQDSLEDYTPFYKDISHKKEASEREITGEDFSAFHDCISGLFNEKIYFVFFDDGRVQNNFHIKKNRFKY